MKYYLDFGVSIFNLMSIRTSIERLYSFHYGVDRISSWFFIEINKNYISYDYNLDCNNQYKGFLDCKKPINNHKNLIENIGR